MKRKELTLRVTEVVWMEFQCQESWGRYILTRLDPGGSGQADNMGVLGY
jgi:hypothetical protein